MKKHFVLSFVVALLMCGMAGIITSCGSDDGVMPLPQNSNYSYFIDDMSEDMKLFYDVYMEYTDMNGIQKTEKVDGWMLKRAEDNGPKDARFYCFIYATLKSELPEIDKDEYAFSCRYKCSVYRPDTKVKDFAGIYEKKLNKADVNAFLNSNKIINICKINL